MMTIESAELRRIATLYDRLPAAVTVALLGILLTCILLFDAVPLDNLKIWVTYMLTTLAGRSWLWYRFRHAPKLAESLWRWELAFAVGALSSGIGWAALVGPLYPANSPALQTVIVLLLFVTAFTGAILSATSRLAYIAIVVPTLLPAVLRLTASMPTRIVPVVAGAMAIFAVFLLIQRTLYGFAKQNFARGEELELLLAEQETIFESATMGIAVLHGEHIVKCNKRLGELLGRGLRELAAAPVTSHFVSVDEAATFLADSHHEIAAQRPVQGIYRLRRADGSQFWAEFSGRSMGGNLADHSVWLIADVTMRVAQQPK